MVNFYLALLFAHITLASLDFPIDLYPLDLSGTDVVLGVQWLTQVSPFIMDYNGPFMRFMWEGQMIELKGEQGRNPTPITAHQLKRLQQTNRLDALFQLTLEPSPSIHSHISVIPHLPSDTAIPSSSTPQLQHLLTTYFSLFFAPTTLPLSRSTDHSITLLPNTAPILVHFYRYPYFQKQEIEA